MAQQITDAEIEERTHLLELVKISTEVFSRQQYERLKELSNKMFALAGSPHIAKENTKHMAQQAAVEWLFEQLGSHIGFVDDSEAAKLNEYIAKAKRMHEEQVIDAYKHGQNNGYNYRSNGRGYITGEEYYEQTFTTQAQ